MTYRILHLVLSCALFMAIGCTTPTQPPSAIDTSQAIKSCASSEVLPGSAIRYTGPVSLGPGSEWVRLRGGFLKADLLTPGAPIEKIFEAGIPSGLMNPDPPGASCKLAASGHVNLGVTFGVDIKTLPVSGKLKTDLSGSKVLSVEADGFQWTWINLIVFNDALSRLPDASPYRGKNANNLEVAVGMLRVKNYVATLDISSATGVNVGGSYSGPLPKDLTGDLQAGVTAQVNQQGHLELRIPAESYVAGVFRPINPASGQVESGRTGSAALEPFVWTAAAVQVDRRAP